MATTKKAATAKATASKAVDAETTASIQSRKSKQEARNVENLEAYAAAKKIEFDLAWARMQRAIAILRDVRETYPEVDPHIKPTTTSFDTAMEKVEARSKEILDKAEKKRDAVVKAKTTPKKKMGRPRTKPET